MAWLGNHRYFRGLALICSAAIAPGDALLYGQAAPQSSQTANQQNQIMSPEQMDSLVAPVALYPDSLLAQVLAASTYPLQIVTARRWVQEKSNLKGKDLVMAAGKQDWDPSVQALVAFPSVLQMLDQNLEWTTALGNVFLAQQSDLMAAVQRMRGKAQQSGKLESNTQQTVQTTAVEGQPTIVIQPADPQVIYVPSYDPAVMYGAAPEYYPYPSLAYPSGVWAAGAISFGIGVAVGAIFNGCCGAGWGWGWGCNWGRHPSLYVNNNFFNHNGNTFVNRGQWGDNYRGNGNRNWNHNPKYRGAVPYANRDVANRFNGGRAGSMRPAQQPANLGNIRPPSSQGGASRLAGAGAGAGNIGGNRPGMSGGSARPGAGQLPANVGANRPGAGQLPANVGANRPGAAAGSGIRPSGSTGSANRIGGSGQWGGWSGSNPSIGNRGGAFGGGSGSWSRSSSSRGFGSMGGGGSRGGGGGFRGGGGGRRR